MRGFGGIAHGGVDPVASRVEGEREETAKGGGAAASYEGGGFGHEGWVSQTGRETEGNGGN